ncbi:MAG: hypothetical protein AAGH99_02585 [Planctomycetota bacterium]
MVTSSEETVDLDAMRTQADAISKKRSRLFMVAILVGVLWGGASEHFGIGWSWPIVFAGAYFGYAWRRVGQGSAGWAVGLTVGLYLLSAVTASTMGRYYPSERVIDQDPAVLQAAVHLKMQQAGELPELTGVGRIGSNAAGELGEEVVTAFDIERLVEEEIDRMSPGEQRSALSWYYDQAGGRAGVGQPRGFFSRLSSGLWLIGAGWLAWRLATHREEIDLG